MKYNIYVRTGSYTYNIFGISEDQLSKLVEAYSRGDSSITLSGKKHPFSEVLELKIFTYQITKPLAEAAAYYLDNIHFRKQRRGQVGYFLPASTLGKMGKDATREFLGDTEYGYKAKLAPSSQDSKLFVSQSRIQDLIAVSSKEFDLTRLIRLCQEINSNYSNNNHLSVGMIGRTIINHIPPIFGYASFAEVASNYGGPKEQMSFKKNMKHLNESLKNIADSFLHQTIRKKEILPNEIQVDFKQDLDVLLAEVVRVLKLV